MNRRLLAASALLFAAGCVLPRSSILGQTAAPVGAGNAEVGISTGLAFVSESSPPVTAGQSTTVTGYQTLWAPGLEGNATIGLSDWLGINFHVSEAGLQPGVKIHILSGNLNLALLPELAFGFASQSQGATVTTGSTAKALPGNTNYYVSFLAGAKLLVSHSSGLYGGVGYDFQSLTYNVVDNTGTNQGTQSQEANILSFAAGYSFEFHGFSLRPELAFLILPSNTNGTALGTKSTTLGGGSGFVLFPNVTVAAASGKGGGAPAEGMKPEELSLPPLIPVK